MSNRDSLGFGDLLPQDVVQVFAHEKHGKKGTKKRSHSLGRALGWLKGKKRKDLGSNRQNLGLGPALDLALDGHPAGHQGGHKGGQRSGRQAHPHGNSHAVPKRDDDDKAPAPLLLQENVFIEASRPKYLEDLHTEALEGLKLMQQEETSNGVEYQDNESTISNITVHTDREGGGFTTDSTIPDTSSVVSVQSSVSTRSSRSGLTRQASTFRPLNSGKKSEKMRRRRHRKTVAGIPHHVQRELGLDRVAWTLTQKLDEEQFCNGESDTSPTTDGPQQSAESQKGARAGLQDRKGIQPLNKEQVERLNAAHAGHRDDLALLHRLGPDLTGGDRPRSLAVPWMTTANSLQPELPSPVMSMSPQAAYMSKIIPNAVLPPSIEVVEISRGRSRSSLRTVSKSSLLLSSPAPSRASSRASSTRTTSSKASNITSASRYNPPNVSDSSCWSNSESSETLVSDSSTISSSSTPRQRRSQDGDASAKEDKVSVHSSLSKASKCTSNGKLVGTVDTVKKEGPFVRSLSVMKPKKAPPPPSRSYSLHNKMKRRSRDLAEVRVSGESSLHKISAAVDTVSVSASVRTLRELFNIPPPPKVHAPPPPPPEVWAHSKRSIELLLGPPAPDNLEAIIKRNPKDRRQQRQSPSASTEGSLHVLGRKKVQESSLTSIKHQSTPASTENQSQELTLASVIQEETTPIVTPSLLQKVKLRSVNSSPEPPKAQEQPQAEVTMRKQQPPSNQVPTPSASGEAPQKPIRRSLIITSPTSTSPPVIVTSQPGLPKSPSASSSTVPSPTKKSPPAMTASPSMNLQEAIRLRTAARSKESATSRLSLHSPTSPLDLHKSPTSTASFIFSKSNKRVVIETKSVQASVQNNLEVSAVTKVLSETESLKKVPPPVAKKPKSKAKENETSEGMEQTAGQEAQQEGIQDAAEKTNGTAGTVEGGEMAST
ncbi:uncharacterized protein AKAME5_001426000 [Lates japonicus]|uniref:Uncharacterized protein n=1 Tax=Lates japonicus TaxID=270547 RepID=A0AAD3RB83_LATJO|nr:uncharacterized protein AKAME5_001426000 [Lates japonicus]